LGGYFCESGKDGLAQPVKLACLRRAGCKRRQKDKCAAKRSIWIRIDERDETEVRTV
jgi:hypothetical protein